MVKRNLFPLHNSITNVTPARLVTLLSKLMLMLPFVVSPHLVFATTVVAQVTPDPRKVKADRLHDQAIQQQQTGQLQTVLQPFQQVLALYRAINGWADDGNILNGIGIGYRDLEPISSRADKKMILQKLVSESTSTCSATPYQVSSLASSPDNRYLIALVSRFSSETGLFDYQIKQWDLINGEEVSLSFELSTSLSDSSQGSTTHYFLGSVAFAPDGRTLVGAYYNNVYNVIVKSWQLDPGTETHTLQIHFDSKIRRTGYVQLSSDGNTLIRYVRDYFGLRTVILWDLASNRMIRTVQFPQPVDGAAVSLNNQTIAIQETDHTISVQNLSNGKPINGKPIQTVKQGSENWNILALSSDGKTLVVGNINGLIQIFNTTTGQLIHTLEPVNSSFDAPFLAISADNRMLFTGHKGKIQQWNMVTGRLIHTLCIR